MRSPRWTPSDKDDRWAEPLHAVVEKIGNCYLEAGMLSSADAQEFREAVEQLATMYKRHIEIEDRRVFPVAARLLPKEAKDEICTRDGITPQYQTSGGAEIKTRHPGRVPAGGRSYAAQRLRASGAMLLDHLVVVAHDDQERRRPLSHE